MKQKTVEFRELLERLLPLDELVPMDRFRVRNALRDGVTAQLEQAALYTLARLEQAGAVRRLDVPEDRSALRYAARDTLDVFTVELPAPRQHEGVQVIPRAALPAQAQAGLDTVRQLLRLDQSMLTSDPRSGDARLGLLEQLDLAGRELLGADEARFFPAGESAGPSPCLDPALADEVRGHPELLYHCPDLELAPRLAAAGATRGARACVLVAVASGDGTLHGHLEVLARNPEAFGLDELAMAALLADSCAGALERAARIERLVFVDPLTAVYNRSYFDLQLRNEMARAQRENASMALAIADIDDFKSFNTEYGYEAGNQVLAHTAEVLRAGVRPFDTVARWGGEEFAVLLTAPVQAEDVGTVFERLRSLVERQAVAIVGLDGLDHRLSVTVSVGVAMFPDHGDSAQALWRAANQALLLAKRPPKNRVVFHQPVGSATAS